jgi:hypothetical protein
MGIGQAPLRAPHPCLGRPPIRPPNGPPDTYRTTQKYFTQYSGSWISSHNIPESKAAENPSQFTADSARNFEEAAHISHASVFSEVTFSRGSFLPPMKTSFLSPGKPDLRRQSSPPSPNYASSILFASIDPSDQLLRKFPSLRQTLPRPITTNSVILLEIFGLVFTDPNCMTGRAHYGAFRGFTGPDLRP